MPVCVKNGQLFAFFYHVGSFCFNSCLIFSSVGCTNKNGISIVEVSHGKDSNSLEKSNSFTRFGAGNVLFMLTFMFGKCKNVLEISYCKL